MTALFWAAPANMTLTMAAAELNTKSLRAALIGRDTAKAEDMMRHAVVAANKYFDKMYK